MPLSPQSTAMRTVLPDQLLLAAARILISVVVEVVLISVSHSDLLTRHPDKYKV